MSLKGQIAFITGASRGIGRAIALRLAQADCDLALVARSERELRELAADIKAAGREALPLICDLREEKQVRQAVDQALEHYGRIDILVNNAGLWHYAPVTKLTLAQWDEMFDVNLRAAFLCTNYLLPAMLARKKGHIINIGSVSGLEAEEEGAGYCATKFGLRGFSQVLEREVGGKGIRVTLVSPGAVNNSLSKSAAAQSDIQVQDVAEAVFLAVTLPGRVNLSEATMRPSH
ncbi:MAG TPA: SDR family oxidoreductase [Anaerolineae bacterium]